MARQPRFQYAGAVYHVMARGDGGKQIFIRKEDHESFLYWLEKGDRRKVICAAIAKGRTAVGNEWLAERLAMGHGSYVSTLVQRIRRDKKEQGILKKHGNI